MGNMNIHIGTGPKYEYSYNLANLRENWAPKKKSPPGPDPTYERGSGDIRPIPQASLINVDYFPERNLSPLITLEKRQSVVQHRPENS